MRFSWDVIDAKMEWAYTPCKSIVEWFYFQGTSRDALLKQIFRYRINHSAAPTNSDTLFNPKIYKPYPSTIPNVLQVATWRDGMSLGGDEQNG